MRTVEQITEGLQILQRNKEADIFVGNETILVKTYETRVCAEDVERLKYLGWIECGFDCVEPSPAENQHNNFSFFL